MRPDRFHFSSPNADRDRAELARMREYELRQQAWLDEQAKLPMVAPGLYDAAMRRIAKECGV